MINGDSQGSRPKACWEQLRTALTEAQLVLYYQPQVDITTDEVVGVEALVRWAHPALGLLPPIEFLPLAEVHNLMGNLTDQVLILAVNQVAAWRSMGLNLRMSVNMSASNLLDIGLPDRLSELLRAKGVPPETIVLEVTETVLMSDLERGISVANALAGLGATVSIDDFGTGFASLTDLRSLPVGELKLDRSFTSDLLTDSRAAAIVSSTIDLAHILSLRVVAEGIEDVDTLNRLKALGCDDGQGYFYAPPLAPEALKGWLEAREATLTESSKVQVGCASSKATISL